jgi:hypothetical protein
MSSIDLFEGDDEGKFVLERERAERPEEVGAFDDVRGESVCATDDEGTSFSGISLDLPDFLGKGAAGQSLAPFVEDEAKASFTPAEHLSALTRRIRRLDVGGLDRAEASQARQVFGNTHPGINQTRFTNRDDAPAQG